VGWAAARPVRHVEERAAVARRGLCYLGQSPDSLPDVCCCRPQGEGNGLGAGPPLAIETQLQGSLAPHETKNPGYTPKVIRPTLTADRVSIHSITSGSMACGSSAVTAP
jgi:hypothetical protein